MQLLLDLDVGDGRLARPDSPVNHSTQGFWFLSARAWLASMSVPASGCSGAPQRLKSSMPAPTVRLVSRSTRMKAPVARLWHRRRTTIGLPVEAEVGRAPISLSSSVLAATVLERVDVDLVLDAPSRSP
jgi:hypothetical protein